MAIENARKFLKQVSEDKTLCERAAEKEAADVVAIAKELGFDVTPEELTAAAKELLQTAGNERKELDEAEQEKVAGGVTHPVDGIVNLFSWIACGFHHNYKYTGKKQTRIDFIFRVTFYQRICQDCGHEDWTRSEP